MSSSRDGRVRAAHHEGNTADAHFPLRYPRPRKNTCGFRFSLRLLFRDGAMPSAASGSDISRAVGVVTSPDDDKA